MEYLPLQCVLLLVCHYSPTGYAASICKTSGSAAASAGGSEAATRGATSVLFVVEEDCAGAAGCSASASGVDQEQVIRAVELAVHHVNEAQNLCNLSLQLSTESAQVSQINCSK